MFEQNADSVYELALADLPSEARIDVRGLQLLCRTLSVLMRDGFRVDTRANAHIALGNRGGYLVMEEYAEDRAFLEALYSGQSRKSEFQGSPTTRACLDFFLGEFPWDESVRRMRLLRVAPEDADAIVSGSPRYQRLSLIDCAREVVRSPHRAFEGLRDDGMLKGKGWAYCGTPSRLWRKDGSNEKPPEGFVFVVFTDSDGFVFDWDWVKVDPGDPGLPLDFADRFSRPTNETPVCELLVGTSSRVNLQSSIQSARGFPPLAIACSAISRRRNHTLRERMSI